MRLDHIDCADVHVRTYDQRSRTFGSRHVTVIGEHNRYHAAVIVAHHWHGALDQQQLVDLLLDAAARAAEAGGGTVQADTGDDRLRAAVPGRGDDNDGPGARPGVQPAGAAAVPAGDDRPGADDDLYLRIADRAADDRYGSRADDPDADDDPC